MIQNYTKNELKILSLKKKYANQKQYSKGKRIPKMSDKKTVTCLKEYPRRRIRKTRRGIRKQEEGLSLIHI